jgi:hypothetical protein
MAQKLFKSLRVSWDIYLKYFYIVIGLGLALLILMNTFALESFDILSGNLAYIKFTSFFNISAFITALLFGLIVQAFFVTLLIYVIKRDLLDQNKRIYLLELVKKFMWQLFFFNVVINLICFFIFMIFAKTIVWYIGILLILLIYLASFFVNQSIIIDEQGIPKAIEFSVRYMKKNITKTIFLLVVGLVIYFIIFLLSIYFSFGYFIGIILFNLFLYPFIEILKSVLYLTKFKIFESYL